MLALHPRKDPELDVMPNTVIRAVAQVISGFLAGIYNDCLQLSYFPEVWKREGKVSYNHQEFRIGRHASNYTPQPAEEGSAEGGEENLFHHVA